MAISPNQTAQYANGGAEVVVVPVIFGVIFLLGVTGNALVIAVLLRVRCLHCGSSTSIFILNLSAADLAFLLFCVPFQATIYSLPHWVFGAFLCKFVHYFVAVSMLVSVFTLVAMSVDRYVAVVHASKSRAIRRRQNALAGACVMWLLSLVLSVPVAQQHVQTGHPEAPNSSFCWEAWSHRGARHTYKVTILLVGYLLPLLLITCSYARTAQTVLLVVAAFMLCWMPHHVIAMWVEFGTFPLNDASFAFRIISHCLAYGNSCINPILYAFMSENFRKACRQSCSCSLGFSPPPAKKAVRIRMENFSTTHSTTNFVM